MGVLGGKKDKEATAMATSVRKMSLAAIGHYRRLQSKHKCDVLSSLDIALLPMHSVVVQGLIEWHAHRRSRGRQDSFTLDHQDGQSQQKKWKKGEAWPGARGSAF